MSIDYRAAAAVHASAPWSSWPLLWLEQRQLGALRSFMRTGTPTGLPPSSDQIRSAASLFSSPMADAGLIGVQPHRWINPLEHQATGALSYFIGAADPAKRVQRISCFIKATWALADRTAPELQPRRAKIEAEARDAAGRRTDLLAWLESAEGTRTGVIVEAKIGHSVTPGQLRSYVTGARRLGLTPNNTAFLVIAPQLTRNVARQLRSNPDWAFASWRNLLLQLGQAVLAAGCDDDDFRRFRRTLFDQLSGAAPWNFRFRKV